MASTAPISHSHGTTIPVGREPLSPSGSSIESNWPVLSHVLLPEPITVAQEVEVLEEPHLGQMC